MKPRLVCTAALIPMLVLLAACGGGKREPVEDILTTHPDLCSLVFENDYVSVVEFALGPGDELPLHHGGKRVVYALSDYTIEWTEGEAEPITKEWTTGAVHFHDAVAHAARNTGTTAARYLVVSRKPIPLPVIEAYGGEKDAAADETDHSQTILENEHVKVIEVRIAPGDKQATHQGMSRVIYSLSDYTITYRSDRAGTAEMTAEAGEAHWHGPDAHAVENTGETEAHYLITAWKK